MQNIKEIIERQRVFYDGATTKDVHFRKEKLKVLREAIIKNEQEIMEALKKDLNKSSFEAYATEIGMVLEEISYTIKHLSAWEKPKKVRTPITQFKSSSTIYSDPFGVVLIMSPWNYPFQLTLSPLVGAIAAGNCSIIKPSNYSPHTSAVINKLIWQNFDDTFISVIQGGREQNSALLEEKFDYIFFTGSVEVGKVVMEAASKHLTPVTLELGGKSPCIVDETANIDLAAKRIVWGKFLNAGQTCVAPDYLLVHSSVKGELINRLRHYIGEFYGEDPSMNADYPKIINEKHYHRLINLMKSGNVVFGGQYVDETLQIAPAIMNDVTWNSDIMQEEIFGPILPLLEFQNLNEAVSEIAQRPSPLALYLFTNDKNNEQYVIKKTSFGGGCINDTIVHLATPHMPFGGVGDSGMGGYHGRASFELFSHKKSILKKSNRIDLPLRYPPYKKSALRLLKKIMR